MEIFSSETNAKPGQPTTNIQRAWLQLCKLRCILHWTHIGIWAVDDSISSKIGPLVEDDSDEDQNDAISVRLQDKALWKQDAKRPFTSSSAEESQKSDAFDFESGDIEKLRVNLQVMNPLQMGHPQIIQPQIVHQKMNLL